jgi:hypothetical protein
LETEHVEHRKKTVAGAAIEFVAGLAVTPVAMTLSPEFGVPALPTTSLIPSLIRAVANDS